MCHCCAGSNTSPITLSSFAVPCGYLATAKVNAHLRARVNIILPGHYGAQCHEDRSTNRYPAAGLAVPIHIALDKAAIMTENKAGAYASGGRRGNARRDRIEPGGTVVIGMFDTR
jgi:hypothetical protein